jgi:hypothetical protein
MSRGQDGLELLRRDRVHESLAGTSVTSALHVGPCGKSGCGELDIWTNPIELSFYRHVNRAPEIQHHV